MTFYQAIQTTFLPPTNHRGSRIVAKAAAKRSVYSWNHNLGVDDNHKLAAWSLAVELGWISGASEPDECMVAGALPGDQGYCFVITKYSKD